MTMLDSRPRLETPLAELHEFESRVGIWLVVPVGDLALNDEWIELQQHFTGTVVKGWFTDPNVIFVLPDDDAPFVEKHPFPLDESVHYIDDPKADLSVFRYAFKALGAVVPPAAENSTS